MPGSFVERVEIGIKNSSSNAGTESGSSGSAPAGVDSIDTSVKTVSGSVFVMSLGHIRSIGQTQETYELQNHMLFEHVLDGLYHVFRLALRELDDRAGFQNTAVRSELRYLLQLLGILLRGRRRTGGSIRASV